MQEMKSEEPLAKPARLSRRGSVIVASVLLHLMVILPFFIHLPSRPPEVQPEESVSVEIVPPPEPQKPEPPPEPPQPEPPPPEPPAPEPPAPEPPAPEPPPQAPEPQQQAAPPPVPTLRPVFRFGEQSSGPEQSAEGNSADGEKAAAEEAPKPEAQPETEPAPQPAEPQPEPPAPEETAPTEPEPTEQKSTEAAPGETAAEEPAAEAAPPVLSAEADAASEAVPQITLPSKVAVPQPRPEPPANRAQPEPKPVKRLYSTARTGNAKAATAMAGIPRAERAGQLCASELQAQLLHGSPSYLPELLPAYRLPSGTDVLNVPRGAFRAEGVWYNISFLCTLNADATEVEAFSYAVGARVPRAEWRERGFPSF
ncbi:DUF930 domain-containing protein [Rhizobium sp. CSW-27]|uniref:DUF930 domain-containing protein n=1 Tax=Rhizobium sp. CSW-27 TaxID=2839985 RepID=UPI001C02E548|nr:DUF930 domain-containing protein [Rhizobium sp. CSW-27]MBT9372549.1 DUF930 domain-containing protein [Rhizobium sp. CSW-27]